MAFTTKGKTIVVEEETHKLTKQDIEFLLNIIENSMVPGKYVGLANHVIGKLRNQHKMAGRSEFQIKQAMSDWKEKKTKPKPKQEIKQEGNEIWIEEK
tara:strand:+ start:602 stop:895 length:294 start_codon:yes stop_codon:yes gene_type:complete